MSIKKSQPIFVFPHLLLPSPTPNPPHPHPPSYDKFASTSISLPDPLYQYFMTSLLSTVRDNVADALEVSYESMVNTPSPPIPPRSF